MVGHTHEDIDQVRPQGVVLWGGEMGGWGLVGMESDVSGMQQRHRLTPTLTPQCFDSEYLPLGVLLVKLIPPPRKRFLFPTSTMKPLLEHPTW